MLNKKIEEALNKQINAELFSSYLYLSMAAYFDSLNLSGFSNWMRCQAQEEIVHGMNFFNYVHKRGGRVILSQIESPLTEWNSPLDVFEYVCKHEQKVTSLINTLVDLAISEKDHTTNNMLQWFVNEQIEEEASAGEVVQKLKLVKGEGQGLFMIDRELAGRTFNPQASVSST